MIIFIDGVDGSGKTTFIQHLANRLTCHGEDVHITPALWQYLSTITTPDQFEPWVTTTDGAGVAIELLEAMTRRVRHFQHEATLAHSFCLVDRGPKTVHASAVARLSRPLATAGRLGPAECRLTDATAGLAGTTRCQAVEIRAELDDANTLVAAPRIAPADIEALPGVPKRLTAPNDLQPSLAYSSIDQLGSH